jgi:3-phenylpropionate/trans-cinnamate dioxygenase ferredoxin reductase subunit
MTDTILIAGAGHAAGQTIVSLRQGGYGGKLILVGEEPYLPYQRPPLSKKFLAGELDVPRLLVRQEKFYADQEVDVRLSTRVNAIDRSARTATLSTGVSVPWSKLVIATGSRVRKASLPGRLRRALPAQHRRRGSHP